jgi:hypothetical protein
MEAADLRAKAIGIVGKAAKEYPEYRPNRSFIGAICPRPWKSGKINQIIYVPTEANIRNRCRTETPCRKTARNESRNHFPDTRTMVCRDAGAEEAKESLYADRHFFIINSMVKSQGPMCAQNPQRS